MTDGLAPQDVSAPPISARGRPRLRRIALLRTIAFRIVLLYVALFAISAAAILAFTYWNTKRVLDAQTDSTILADVSSLEVQYQQQGIVGLIEAISARAHSATPTIYLLADPNFRLIDGNLDRWPQAVRIQDGAFVAFKYQRGGEIRRARGFAIDLTGGFHLLVARDVHEQYESERLFTTALPWSLGLLLLLALGGGILLSRGLLHRLDSINSTSREIMAGDLTRRVPLNGSNDEFDVLAANLNSMLDRIEQLMKGMREVTDSVAHDLRSPLNRLRNRLERVSTRLDPESDLAADVDFAIGETDHLIATFNALLLIAEAEAGVVREAMSVIDVATIVADVAELYAPVAEEKSITLSLDLGQPVQIEANRSLISQALANLIDNAIKYTPNGGTVSIVVAERGGFVALIVADNGPGIPSADLARVTDRFVRLEASRNSPGTGLGLALVAAVARLHDGHLILADNQPGLRVTLELPRGPRRPATASTSASRLARQRVSGAS